MPMPKTNEKESEFIKRCMSDNESNKSFPDTKQRLGFCFSQFKKAKGGEKK